MNTLIMTAVRLLSRTMLRIGRTLWEPLAALSTGGAQRHLCPFFRCGLSAQGTGEPHGTWLARPLNLCVAVPVGYKHPSGDFFLCGPSVGTRPRTGTSGAISPAGRPKQKTLVSATVPTTTHSMTASARWKQQTCGTLRGLRPPMPGEGKTEREETRRRAAHLKQTQGPQGPATDNPQ